MGFLDEKGDTSFSKVKLQIPVKYFIVSGLAFKTYFYFTCTGWKEWEGPGKLGHIKFEYKIRQAGETRYFFIQLFS